MTTGMSVPPLWFRRYKMLLLGPDGADSCLPLHFEGSRGQQLARYAALMTTGMSVPPLLFLLHILRLRLPDVAASCLPLHFEGSRGQ